MDLQFETLYKFSTVALRTIGAHPDVAKDYKWLARFMLLHGYYTLAFMFFAYNMIIIDIKQQKDFIKACSHSVYIVVYVVVSFFYLMLLCYQKEISTIIQLQQKFFDSTRDFPAEDQKIIYGYATKGRWVSKLWMVSVFITLGMFPVKGMILTSYSVYKGNVTLYPFADNVYPSAIESKKERLDVFGFIYFLHVLYAIYTGFMYTGFSPLGPIFIFNACARVELLTKKASVLFEQKQEFNREEAESKIKALVQDMQDIYSYVNRLNDIFKIVFELCLKASAVLIPVALFVILRTLEQGEIGLDYIMFIYNALLLCLVPCYCGDLLMEKGENLRFALYASGWEKHYHRGIRSSLLIMLARANKPICISSVFRIVCLDTFCEICRQSYTLFNVMNAGLNINA